MCSSDLAEAWWLGSLLERPAATYNREGPSPEWLPWSRTVRAAGPSSIPYVACRFFFLALLLIALSGAFVCVCSGFTY